MLEFRTYGRNSERREWVGGGGGVGIGDIFSLPNDLNYSSKHRLQLINAFYYHRIFSIVLKGPQGLGARGENRRKGRNIYIYIFFFKNT